MTCPLPNLLRAQAAAQHKCLFQAHMQCRCRLPHLISLGARCQLVCVSLCPAHRDVIDHGRLTHQFAIRLPNGPPWKGLGQSSCPSVQKPRATWASQPLTASATSKSHDNDRTLTGICPMDWQASSRKTAPCLRASSPTEAAGCTIDEFV